LPRWAAEGGLVGTFAVGAETVVIAAVAARAYEVANPFDPTAGHALAITVKVLVPAAGALLLALFVHGNTSPGAHR